MTEDEDSKGTPPRKPVPKPWPRWLPFVILLSVGALFLLAQYSSDTKPNTKISYSEFIKLVEDGKVKEIDYDPNSGKIEGKLKDASKDAANFSTDGPNNDFQESVLRKFDQQNVSVSYERQGTSWLYLVLPYLVPIVFVLLIFGWMSRRASGQMGSVMSIGRTKAKVYTTEKPKTTFSDVAGYKSVKEEITEVVDFLKYPGKFREIGARIPRGVLLVGPPGTGKTLIARAVAGEAGVPFVSVTGSDFMEMFVGVGAARVRDLFQNARKQAPAIIFVDEIDSIGRKRGAGLGGGHDEREQTLNQMLSEMDGFEPSEGIVMMAATNRPDILDPALLRPGRFDRQVMVPLPTKEERKEILKVHFRDKKIDEDVDLDIVARGTPGMSGADLANLVNEAALFAVRREVQAVHKVDFENARDRIFMGLKRPIMMSDKEKELTAFHESGHAIAAYVLEHADPVHKVTILPVGMALGVTHMLPKEERHSYNLHDLHDRLAVALGGRCAEKIKYGIVSSGAQNDLVNATDLAHNMVSEYGMSERIGPMAWSSNGTVFLGEDFAQTRAYSEETAHIIDEEVEKILREQEERCIALLTDYRAGLDALASALLEREELDGDEVAKIVDTAMGRVVKMRPDPEDEPVATGPDSETSGSWGAQPPTASGHSE